MPIKIEIPKNEVKNGIKKHNFRKQGITAQTIELLQEKRDSRANKIMKITKEIEELDKLLTTIRLTLVDGNKL